MRVPNGVSPGHDRLIAAYHDFAGTKEMVDGGYQLINGASRMAWAHSDDLGQTWVAHPQIQADNADAGEVLSLRGDPFIAQVNGTVFYVALASPAPTGPINRIVLARLPANSLIFEPFRAIVLPQANEGIFDGPRIAITPDGQDSPRAIVTWREVGGTHRAGYVVLSNLLGNITTEHRGILSFPAITYTAFAEPANCVAVGTLSGMSTEQDTHPTPTIGMSGMAYIGVRSMFSPSNSCTENRLDVYRADLRAAGPLNWQRITSTPSRNRDGSLRSAGVNEARKGQWGAIGVSRVTEPIPAEVVSVLSESRSTEVLAGEMDHAGLQYVRLPFADTCEVIAGPNESCVFNPVFGAANFDPERSYLVRIRAGTTYVSLSNNRPGVLRVQPTLVTHPNDSRVAAFRYAQPFYFRSVLPPNTAQSFTTIEGVFSTNGGVSFGPLRRLAVLNDSTLVDQGDGGAVIGLGPTSVDASAAGLGLMFDPCLYRVDANFYMFGDYISGTFLNGPDAGAIGTGLNPPYQIYGTWTDSPHGCGSLPTSGQAPVFHHHVFGGSW